MLNLENFMKLLEDAMPSSDGMSLNEKIMSKKAARRRKKKLAAAKKAAEEAKKQEIEQTEEEEEKEKGTGTALIVYKEEKPTEFDDYEKISEPFINFINNVGMALENHKKEIEAAMSEWKQAGEDKPCPQNAWDAMYNSINTLKNTVEQAVDQLDVDKLGKPEVIVLDRYVTGLNGYIEKAYQQIMAVKPNLSEQDFQAPAVQQDGEVATTTGTALAPTTGTSLATTGDTEEVDTSALEDDTNKLDDKKRHRKDIIDYNQFSKSFKDCQNALEGLRKAIGVIANTAKEGFKKIIALAAHPVDWFSDKLFGFLTAPLAKDIVKTFMYANPFTKMLFDGDFGKFGFADKIEKLHQKVKEGINGAKGIGGDPSKSKPENYTKRKFPKDISEMTFKELKRNIYGSKAIVDCINVSYNHPEVKDNDKAKVLAYVEYIEKAFKEKKPDSVRSNFKSLIKILNKICDYMDWNKPEDWQRLVKLYVKVAGGNTRKQTEKIRKKADDVEDAGEKQSNFKDISDWTEEDINNLPAGAIKALSKRLGLKQEAYTEEKITKLEKLLEEAEGDK